MLKSVLVTAAFLTGATLSAAQAGLPTGGAPPPPPPVSNLTFTDHGTSLNASFEVTVGPASSFCGTDINCLQDASNFFVHLNATGVATATCNPPHGMTRHVTTVTAAAPIAVTGAITFQATDALPTGNQVLVSITAGPPSSLTIAGAPDCPTSRFVEIITNLAFTGATLTTAQGVEPLDQEQLSCTFNPPTSDGSVPSNTFACQ